MNFNKFGCTLSLNILYLPFIWSNFNSRLKGDLKNSSMYITHPNENTSIFSLISNPEYRSRISGALKS